MTPTDSLQTRPKMRRVCDELEKLAIDLGPNAQLPTMVQLRDSLGVSMKTLHDSMREMEKREVLRSVHGVGIFVAGPKRRVATGTVGFMAASRLTSIQNLSYFGLITAGMRQQAGRQGQDLLLIDNDTPYQNWDKLDGVIVSESHNDVNILPGLQPLPQRMASVAILNRVPDTATVTADDYQGSFLLTQHLISLGHKRIAYLATHSSESSVLHQRRDGYLAALRGAGIEPDPLWMRDLVWREQWLHTADWYFYSGQYYAHQWLAEDWRSLKCTALMVQNDSAAYGVLSAFREAGIDVPGQVSVTGFDGIERANSFLPALTTIQVPLFEIGEAAVRHLAEQHSHPGVQVGDVRLPVKLQAGESSGPPPHALIN